ncbi:MAG: non-ribosomal peptide synthetase [Candidatus Eremiobacteraeota bacterium]|nr:non-ribosomal peptide synthetase [Candidatus Eremiobacteraeota bacterium]
MPAPPSAEEVFVFPVSFSQERLWFLDQFDPGSAAYIIPGMYHFPGPLNVAALERSLNEIVRRHEALRTTFDVVDGEPVQIVAASLTLVLHRVDLHKMPESTRGTEFQRLAAHEARRPFDLAAGPLLRTILVQLGEMDHVLLLTMHHIVSDAWSRDVLFRELSAIYNAYAAGRPSPLPELPLQYADFALWQRERLQGALLDTHLTYWKRRLEGAPAVLELPADRPRPPAPAFRGAAQAFELSASLSDRLRALSQAEGATLFMTLLAAFKTLIHRYTAQTDIVVGTPIANRGRQELEELIGFFVNTLALRTTVAPDLTFRELLRNVRDAAREAYTHQDLPFEKLVRELQPERQVSHNPLFQVMFAFDKAADASPAFAPAAPQSDEPAASVSQAVAGTAKFDLTLFVADAGRKLAGTLEYNTDLFDADRMTRLIGHFQTLLEGIVANPGRRLCDLPLLTPAERRHVTVEWNATRTAYGPAGCVHRLFEAHAARTPDAVAVVFESEPLTYGELNRRANRLAHHLRTLGIVPETRVGLCLDRSPEMIVALLGILKAGGAYVPLDPAYPRERLAFMVSDAEVPVLVTTDGLRNVLPGGPAVVCLDRDAALLAAQREDDLAGGASPDNLVYVIYTSGSTGTPKGVAMPHRPLFNLLSWQIANSELPLESRTLQFHPLSFDVSFQELFSTLCGGGTLVFAVDDVRRDFARLSRYLAEMSIARMFIPPVVLQGLAEACAGANDVPVTLRHIIVAGDQLRITPVVAAFCARLPGCIVRNHYGPTETHLVTDFALTGPPDRRPFLPPIGRPIANVRTYVLSPHLQPVPIGVPGELYIGGDGLARGYLNRPELTAERFVPDPFGDEPGARLYKSGDLVRSFADGNIEFLGRIDHQVKIRGFRIEPGEIEAVLGRHPALRECAVIARDDGSGERRLVAYLVPHDGQAPTTTELRRFLNTTLPEYMLPSSFVLLEALPQSPNGKLERSALPAPQATRPSLEETFVAPSNALETALAAIWAEVLGLERIGVHDNFFELGGHSLLATQLVSRVRDRLHAELPLRRLFEGPTVAELAAAVDELLAERRTEPADPVERMDQGQVEQLLAKLDQLSDAQVEELLRQL